jgi:hypothetical protein
MHRTCAIALGTAALAIAGCGGSKDSSTSSSSTLTKAEFISKANGICRDTKKAQQPFSDRADKLKSGGDVKLVAPILEGGLKESRKGLARLHALPSPSQDKATLDKYYATIDKLLSVQAQLATAARAGDRKTAQKVGTTAGALGDDENRLALKYGIKDCDVVF